MGRAKSVIGPHYDSPIARSLRLLIERESEGSVNAWAKKYKLKQTTVNRISNGSNDVSVATLIDICDAIGYEPWQLLRPDFDPRVLPPMLDARAMRVAAIFAAIKSETDKRRAEAIMEQFSG